MEVEPLEERKEEEEASSEEEADDVKSRMLKDDFDQGEVSSIASSVFSQTRSYYSLRSAIDERFVPIAIKNLKITSYILFIVLIALYSTWFAI